MHISYPHYELSYASWQTVMTIIDVNKNGQHILGYPVVLLSDFLQQLIVQPSKG